MMDFGPLWIWHHLKKLRNTVAGHTAILGHLQTIIRNLHLGSGAIIIRDEPSETEAPPTDQTVNTMLVFRSGHPSLFWDAENTTWL